MASPLRIGQKIRNDSGHTYRVDRRIGEGGFGTVFEGSRIASDDRRLQRVCIKVCRSRHDWHGEAFFGELLSADDRVVRLLDAFVTSTGTAERQRRRHVLVFEYMEDGTVEDQFHTGVINWTEARVRAEVRRLLQVLASLHDFGITHRDLKPKNVYLRNGHLVLGDFGIARLSLTESQKLADALTKAFSPLSIVDSLRESWGPADDVFQVGLLASSLLLDEPVWAEDICAKLVGDLAISDWFKTWIWHATGARSNRYRNAGEALEALKTLRDVPVTPGRAPRSLDGEAIVFSGTLNGLTRPNAKERAHRAGASVQTKVNGQTTLLVLGHLKRGTTGATEGLKLFAVRERIRRGQPIRIIGHRQFERLASAR